MKGDFKVLRTDYHLACPVCGNASIHRDDCYVELSIRDCLIRQQDFLVEKVNERNN